MLAWLTVPLQLSSPGPHLFFRSPKSGALATSSNIPSHRQIPIAHSKMSPAAGANERESNLARVLGSGTIYLFPAGVARARRQRLGRFIPQSHTTFADRPSQALLVSPSWPSSTLCVCPKPNSNTVESQLLTSSPGRHNCQATDEQPDQGTPTRLRSTPSGPAPFFTPAQCANFFPTRLPMPAN